MFAGGAWTEARPPRVSKIGPALSSSNTIRRRPSADPVQKHAPGNGYGAKKGLTSRGPLQKQTFLGRPTSFFPKPGRPLLGTLPRNDRMEIAAYEVESIASWPPRIAPPAEPPLMRTACAQ